MRTFLRKLSRRVLGAEPPPAGEKTSFSQCGEDLIMDHLLRHVLGVQSPTYLDIGSGDPCRLNNTFLFYRRGGMGVCVEPNPAHAMAIRRIRPRDHCVEAGVAGEGAGATLPFHLFDPPTLSTFSPEEAERLKRIDGYRWLGVHEAAVTTLSRLFAEHGVPDILSLDIEGVDEAVLSTNDWQQHRPTVLCIETVDHVTEAKRDALISAITGHDYVAYADTFINTIFVEGSRWRARRKPDA